MDSSLSVTPKPPRSMLRRLGAALGAAVWGVALGVVIDTVIAMGEVTQPGGVLYGLGRLVPGSPYYVFIAVPLALGVAFGIADWHDD